jgi:hypothetical protein
LLDKDKDYLRLGLSGDEDGSDRPFYLSNEERSAHVYVIGSTGVGKSKGLATWILNDIEEGRGCGVIDPHGDLIKDILDYPCYDPENVILVDLTDPDYIITFNPLEVQSGIDPFTQTLELVEVFRKIWELSDVSTPRLLEILRNSIYTLIEASGTMLDIEPLLTNREFREQMIPYVKNEAVASFWRNRFEKWSEKDRTQYIESTLNKVSTFTSDPRIRLVLSSKKSSIDFRAIMDTQKTLLINLSKGALKTNSYLLGALFVAKIQMAAMSRVDVPLAQRVPFYFYVDEFQNYATESFAEILSEARKYGLSLTLAHQSLEQLGPKLRAVILGNAKNFILFRMGRQDAELLVKYILDIDPMYWKLRTESGYTFMSIGEQWEEGISYLVNMPNQVAFLKTMGCDPTPFITYHLPENDLYDSNYEGVRRANCEQGYTKRLQELDHALTFEPVSIYEPDEPNTFVE